MDELLTKKPEKRGDSCAPMLKQEIMLQVNERLYETGVISEEVYEAAKDKIVRKYG